MFLIRTTVLRDVFSTKVKKKNYGFQGYSSYSQEGTPMDPPGHNGFHMGIVAPPVLF